MFKPTSENVYSPVFASVAAAVGEVRVSSHVSLGAEAEDAASPFAGGVGGADGSAAPGLSPRGSSAASSCGAGS